MNRFPFPQEFCKNCGDRLKPQRTGRPGEYCGTACRQAAHRKKIKSHGTRATIDLDDELVYHALNLETDVRQLVTALENPHAPAEEPLNALVRIQAEVDKMLPGTVARARLRGTPWARIGTALSLNKDTARRKYDVETIMQRLIRPRRPAPPAPAAAVSRTTAHEDDADTHQEFTARTPQLTTEPLQSDQLAPVLSHLQRASGMSLRALGERIGLSASHLSRILSGERSPDWDTTARFARACGADPSVLRKVWEDAETRRLTKHRAKPSLASALRYLHRRAGTPRIGSIVIASSNALHEHDVAAVLEGASVPEWETVQRIVLVLDGEPTYFRPLWEAAARHATEEPAPPSTDAQTPVQQTKRLEDLLGTFGSGFKSRPHLPAASRLACSFLGTHPKPAPIPALAHWAAGLP